ncbi:A24 family peptidase [Saccharothrix sp.]|uniref:A24 family peptidase n=1 Tax=Saccharothrix sp. TaxID=1873460 RepID=UPI002811399C|nr:A24 family peptidase [Saccharothrix sp.]
MVIYSLSGFLVGAFGARLLRSLPRGASVHWAWCALPTAGLWALSAGVPPRWLPVPFLVAWLGVLLSVVDFRHRRLPDFLTLPAYPLVGGVLAVCGADLARALGGGLAYFGLHLAVHKLSPASMGGGDVKLAGSLGAVLGSVSWVALPVAAVLASVITLTIALWRPRDGPPHGPGLVGATWLVSLAGG